LSALKRAKATPTKPRTNNTMSVLLGKYRWFTIRFNRTKHDMMINRNGITITDRLTAKIDDQMKEITPLKG
jgi:hypothetical protein